MIGLGVDPRDARHVYGTHRQRVQTLDQRIDSMPLAAMGF
jgi:hypothetical protein